MIDLGIGPWEDVEHFSGLGATSTPVLKMSSSFELGSVLCVAQEDILGIGAPYQREASGKTILLGPADNASVDSMRLGLWIVLIPQCLINIA